MKVTKTKTTTVYEKDRYHLSDIFKYDVSRTDGNETSRVIEYVGKKLNGNYRPWVCYDPDVSKLDQINPFHGDYNWFSQIIPDNPEDVDITKIYLPVNYDHSLYDYKEERVPLLIHGDYIDGGIRNGNYDLEKLHKHLKNHKQVKKIGEIKSVPYYNNDEGCNYYFDVWVLPTKKQVVKMGRKSDIFYCPWSKGEDFLKMGKFWIAKKND